MTSKALSFIRLSFKPPLEGCHKHHYLRTSSTKASSNAARCSLHRDLQGRTSTRLLAISEAFLFELILCLLLECKYCLQAIVTIVPRAAEGESTIEPATHAPTLAASVGSLHLFKWKPALTLLWGHCPQEFAGVVVRSALHCH